MGTSVFGIGISGMNAAQAGLVTTGHNIANASTTGYSRQEIVQSTNIPQFTGYGFLGQGSSVSTVKRIYSDVLNNQLAQAQAQGSQLSTYYAQISQLDSMLGDVSAGLAPALQDFFSGVSDLASHPESVPSRQAVLASANALAARFQNMNEQLTQMRAGINSDISSSVGAINNYARQIANLNHDITVAESAGMQQANDLRDQRDQIIAEMNQEVRASVVKDGNGNYNIFVGNGQPVVVGDDAFTLVVAPSLQDAQRMEVGYRSGSGVALLSSDSLRGGRLGGLLSFRENSLDAAQNGLGRIAIGLAQAFNDQHALGQDLNGALGTDFFDVPDPSAVPSTINTGNATVSATLQDASALTSSDYLLWYEGSDGSNDSFKLTRLSDGFAQSYSFPTAAAYSITMDGVTVAMSMNAGAAVNDNWLIQPTRNGARDIGVALADPSKIAAAAPIRTGTAMTNTGDASISAGSVSQGWLPPGGPLTLTYDGAGNFNVTGPWVGSIPYAPPGGSSINIFGSGINVTISGTPALGDVFTIDSNTNGTSDNRNALALGALQTTNTMGRVGAGNPTTTFQSAYSQLVSQVGNTTRQTEVTAKAQTNLIAQTKQSQQSVAGVNLDEEAANLLRYQQAYQASGKMMQVATLLFQTVLDLGK